MDLKKAKTLSTDYEIELTGAEILISFRDFALASDEGRELADRWRQGRK